MESELSCTSLWSERDRNTFSGHFVKVDLVQNILIRAQTRGSFSIDRNMGDLYTHIAWMCGSARFDF